MATSLQRMDEDSEDEDEAVLNQIPVKVYTKGETTSSQVEKALQVPPTKGTDKDLELLKSYHRIAYREILKDKGKDVDRDDHVSPGEPEDEFESEEEDEPLVRSSSKRERVNSNRSGSSSVALALNTASSAAIGDHNQPPDQPPALKRKPGRPPGSKTKRR
ncbi:hypothetical protein BGZ58_004655 [Dissophora ornata]|nr:hypothetical protein BGZ58_004655 [Dissophora ornata]